MKGSADAPNASESGIKGAGESEEDGIETTSIKSEDSDVKEPETTTEETKTTETKTTEKTDKKAEVKKAAEKKKAAPPDSMITAQYMGIATALGEAGGKVGSASFSAQATTDQADSQKLQALVDNYNNAAGMCNSNIQMTASQVQALDTTASRVGDAMNQMVSATSRS
jgi:hypothetical protein